MYCTSTSIHVFECISLYRHKVPPGRPPLDSREAQRTSIAEIASKI